MFITENLFCHSLYSSFLKWIKKIECADLSGSSWLSFAWMSHLADIQLWHISAGTVILLCATTAESHKCGSSLDGTAEAFICQSKKRSTWFQRSRALNVKRCCGIIGRKRKYCGHTSCFCHSLCWLAQFLQGYLIKVLTLYIYSCRHSCRLNLEPILASIGHDVGYTLDRFAICSGSIFMLSLVFAIILVSWALLDLITAISFVTDPAVFMFLLSPPVSFHICTWKDWEEK